ncbi:N-acetyltransferase family protein [Sphingomonas sp. 1P08PE]|jgi:GNAT superfamily N-acetyltransferase|uniref:GNAT family N-acetyltransferase n=1 Tax=Sphingomonas sp. 1P08PE TaxID=554122 RepID=UPI0039A3EDF9
MTDQGTVELETRSGFWFRVRPTRDADEAKLAAFFRALGPEDLRFRFLSTIREVSHDRLVEMIEHKPETDSVVAESKAGEIVAAAILAGDPATRRGEVAISIRADHKGKGIGWSLLEHLVETARQRGYASIESLEDRQNRSAIALEQEMGFIAEPLDDDPTLVRVSRQLT